MILRYAESFRKILVPTPKRAFILVLPLTVIYIVVFITQNFVSTRILSVSNNKSPYTTGLIERKSISVEVAVTPPVPADSNHVPDTGLGHWLMLVGRNKEAIRGRFFDRNSPVVAAFNADRPIVIQWKTTLYGVTPPHSSLSTDPFQSCPVRNCCLLPPNATYPHVDAYLFHVWEDDAVRMPEQRHPGQKYIFVSQESEIRTPIPTYLKSVFNLTMSHRSDADIPIPYGEITRKLLSHSTPKPGMNFAANKTGFAAWVVSHCHPPSKRDVYVAELQRFISIDVYGKCGTKQCPGADCWGHINNNYKFYLAFENSLCVDYVTEKLYRTLNHGKMIPIVLGGANYSALLPQKSFINVADFESPRKLSQYLKILDRNDALYNEYFQWQYHYSVSDGTPHNCRLCAYLHLNKSSKKIYPDIRQWYSERRCMKPREYYGPYIDVMNRTKIKMWLIQVLQIDFLNLS